MSAFGLAGRIGRVDARLQKRVHRLGGAHAAGNGAVEGGIDQVVASQHQRPPRRAVPVQGLQNREVSGPKHRERVFEPVDVEADDLGGDVRIVARQGLDRRVDDASIRHPQQRSVGGPLRREVDPEDAAFGVAGPHLGADGVVEGDEGIVETGQTPRLRPYPLSEEQIDGDVGGIVDGSERPPDGRRQPGLHQRRSDR